ncbi:MAG: malectin domain-containing carbohydrate-binding protein [Acidobacteriota bacterium]
MSLEAIKEFHPGRVADPSTRHREEIVRRVAASATFEKSPRLRAFFLHVCKCALEDKPEEATEQQIGIYVYGRSPGYNPNDDNIVRSQARVLRMKLEHHFATDGMDEATVITIPKGQYLPVFLPRPQEPSRPQEALLGATFAEPATPRRHRPWVWYPAGLALLVGIAAAWQGRAWFASRNAESNSSPGVQASSPSQSLNSTVPLSASQQTVFAASARDIRIAAGRTGSPYVDVWGRRWDADRYFEGGAVQPGPRHFFPPVPDRGLFQTLREADSDNDSAPESERSFEYNIPLAPGAYEMRLYFADPIRQPDSDQESDAQNNRHFQVVVNRHPELVDFDPVADASFAAIDTRVFKDIYPDTDGKLHLEFRSDWGRAFVSAIELTPGIPGKLKPIRIAAGRRSDFVDADGVRWSGDDDYIDGRTWTYQNSPNAPEVNPLYVNERHGNFSYAIPVPPGSYTLRLHFMEAFFSPLIPAAYCQGVGCRVFDVTCNGVSLLDKFDILQAAGGAFRPVVREFQGLHPNGQGKLLISFSSRANYAEVRAIEVIDEAQ